MTAGAFCPVCAAPVTSSNAFCGACGARMPRGESTATDDGLIGRVIDNRFRVLRLIGAGGMGAVYLAEHVGIGKQVAVKVLRADLRGQSDLVARFRREAMAVSKLTDAHTITVFDFGVWKGLIYLVMEYLRGSDLAHVLDREGRVSEARAIRLGRQICSSLAEAHAVGVVHRDLKPENIFLSCTTSGEELAKVLDFGLAKLVACTESSSGGFQTQDGALLGTPYFMSPEQIRGLSVDARSDLYSLGALLFRMLTGHHPYTGRSPIQVLEGHLSGTLRTFEEMAPGLKLSSDIERLVRRLMSRDMSERPATALQVDDILRALGTKARQTTGPTQALPGDAGTPPTSSAGFPSRFSTSGAHTRLASDDGIWATVGEVEAGAIEEVAPTRDEFAGYERTLKRRGLVRWSLFGALVLGVAGAGYWFFGARSLDPPTVEREPNDQPAEATRMQPGFAIKGHLGRRRDLKRSDRDIYELGVTAGARFVEVKVTGLPNIDLMLEGLSADVDQLAQANETGAGGAERMVMAVPEGMKRVFLVVREVWVEGQPPKEDSTNAYSLVAHFHETAPYADGGVTPGTDGAVRLD